MINSSIRQNVEAALLAWLKASFEGKDEFSGVAFTKGQTSAEIKLPLVSGLCPNAEEVEVPGAGIFRADAALVVMTTIDKGDSPEAPQRAAVDAAHRARADCIANKTEDLAALIAALNATSQVFVFGCDMWKSSHDVIDRHYVDRFEASLMCRCV